MKRIVSISLVLMMVLAMAFSVSVSAKSSPTPKDYYKITVGSEGKGHATESTDKVEIGTDGTVTFTAIEDGGYFTKWIIDGKYEIVSGDEFSSVLVIRPSTDIDAIASFSEEKDYLNVYVSVDPEGYGTATADPARIKKSSDGTVTLRARGENGGTFDKWVIKGGDYEIISGDLNSDVLVIRPFTDIYATAFFTKPGESPEEPTETPETPDDKGKDDSGNKGGKPSPKTGYPVFFVFGMMGLALVTGVVATKKIKG